MKLFHIPLKIIEQFNLMPSDERQTLANDVKNWESDVAENSTDKVKVLYFKLHKPIYTRLILPFVHFFLVKQITDMNKDKDDEGFLN
tara:strand:+ start:27920 stop:28180 length:261 start_codon:yes stop_codon:yes gene_type:complete